MRLIAFFAHHNIFVGFIEIVSRVHGQVKKHQPNQDQVDAWIGNPTPKRLHRGPPFIDRTIRRSAVEVNKHGANKTQMPYQYESIEK
ncbi:hypothetical protein V5E97_20305 [Singulisphaera sp. Ch08]|uniref:Secreted protein n=1 Tax=Singulisphaera sp. Ch08 TaxID=3120278 RepID=A0AAU7C6T6_9BACT